MTKQGSIGRNPSAAETRGLHNPAKRQKNAHDMASVIDLVSVESCDGEWTGGQKRTNKCKSLGGGGVRKEHFSVKACSRCPCKR